MKKALPSLDSDAELVLCGCGSREAGAKIIIVSDAVEGTFVNLDGESFQEELKGKYQREWKRSNGVDRNEKNKEEKNLRCALLNGSAWRMAGDDDRKHTSGGVFVAIDSNLGAVVGAEEGAIESIPGNEGRIA